MFIFRFHVHFPWCSVMSEFCLKKSVRWRKMNMLTEFLRSTWNPETNIKKKHLKRWYPKRNIVFQPATLRCCWYYISVSGCFFVFDHIKSSCSTHVKFFRNHFEKKTSLENPKCLLFTQRIRIHPSVKSHLAGGFKYFLCSCLPGEMIQFDEHIFQMGWFNHQLDISQGNHGFITQWTLCTGVAIAMVEAPNPRVLLVAFFGPQKNRENQWWLSYIIQQPPNK